VAAVLFALTLLLGLTAKSLGQATPELAVDVEMSQDRNPVLDLMALGLHELFDPRAGIVIIAVLCVWLAVVRRSPLRALAFGSITCIGWFSSTLGKITVNRLRPPTEAVHALVTETGNSFPSGHTALAASLAWAFALVLARQGAQRILATIIGAMVTVAVALSRIYLGVHFPTDTIGSILISAAGILAWLVLWNKIIEPALRRAFQPNAPAPERTPLVPQPRVGSHTPDRDDLA
jgi:undecaprenyl-diphosphatase